MKIFLKLNRWVYAALFACYFIPVYPIREIFGISGSILVLLWVYSVSTIGQKELIRENLPNSNLNVFKAFFIGLPTLIVLNFMIGQWFLDRNNATGVVVFVFLVLATIFSTFYLYYFAAKTITILEKRRMVTPKECYQNFICIGLSGLGVFFLQPKVQQLTRTDITK